MIGGWLNGRKRPAPAPAVALVTVPVPTDAEEARLLLWLREVERVQGLVEGGRQDLAPRLGLRQRYVTRLAESFTMREVAA